MDIESADIKSNLDQVFFNKFLVELEINVEGEFFKIFFPMPP